MRQFLARCVVQGATTTTRALAIVYPASTSCPIVSVHTTTPVHVEEDERLTADTPEEFANRNENAPLMRYVEMMRRHGHRAAKVSS